MDIWIINHGEKSGPFPDYTVRAKIASGAFNADTHAWHEGLTKWTPLKEIPLFEREFSEPAVCSTPEIPPSGSESKRDGQPSDFAGMETAARPQCRAIRRFWARWLDLYLYAGLWWFAMWVLGHDIQALLSNLPLMLMIYLPWFGLEVLMIHLVGTTPGKWLLGLRVINQDGSLLSLTQSLQRSLRVFFLGIGMGWEIMALICQAISLYHTRRNGAPLWDAAGQHIVTCTPLRPLRVTTYVLVLFAALQLQSAVLGPYIREILVQRFPELRESLQERAR